MLRADSGMPRHMLGVAYSAEADPNAETSFLGKGKQFHTFGDCCRAAFRQRDGGGSLPALVHRNVRFVPGPVDVRGRSPVRSPPSS